jgi:MoxR-like ATPase
LARALCEAFQVSTFPVTAHEDWTVFDVIGRLELRLHEDRKEEIVPVNGYVTESIIRCANAIVRNFDDSTEPQAEWLLIDELNRAQIDRAFGELFTVLGTDSTLPVMLPHQREGNRSLVIPRRFRIIATLNSFDRQFVNNLSQAIRRRFTFITVDIPYKRPSNTAWDFNTKLPSLAVKEFRITAESAALRVARRLAAPNVSKIEEVEKELLGYFKGPLSDAITSLFNFLEQVRYSDGSQRIPHLPIGTAQIIDTLELFLLRMLQDEIKPDDATPLLDWALSVKIVPLFDADVVAPDILREFAESLPAPFNKATRRELLGIAAAGMYFVE